MNELSALFLFQRMAISQAYLEKWDQKAKKVKKDLPLIRQANLGFQASMAHQDSVVHLVPPDPLVSAWRGMTRTHRNIFASFKDSCGKAKWESRLRQWNKMSDREDRQGRSVTCLSMKERFACFLDIPCNIWEKRRSVLICRRDMSVRKCLREMDFFLSLENRKLSSPVSQEVIGKMKTDSSLRSTAIGQEATAMSCNKGSSA